MAQPFNVTRLELSGDPVVVQDGIEEHRTWWMFQQVSSLGATSLSAFID